MRTNAPVTVVGGINMDIRFAAQSGGYTRGSSTPGAARLIPGGVARNIAHNLAVLSVPVKLLGVVGDDAFGRQIINHTSGAGVDTAGVELIAGETTGIYAALLTPTGELDTGASSMGIIERIDDDWIEGVAAIIADSSVIVADTNLGEDALRALIRISASHGVPLVIEPVSVAKASRLVNLTGDVFVATPSAAEAVVMQQSTTLLVRHLVVTDGARGARWTDSETGASLEIPAAETSIVDVTGAGDAFCAGVIAGLVWGNDMPVALTCAAHVAGSVVAHSGSTIPIDCAAGVRRLFRE